MALKIALRLAWMNGKGFANYIGDHAVALAWKKYLERRQDVERVDIIATHDIGAPDIDCCVHFHHWTRIEGHCRNLYYVQNAWPPGISLDGHIYEGGTPEVFRSFKHHFDGYIFPSDQLGIACLEKADNQKPSCVIPFAVDPERFYPQKDARFAHPVAFVGNDIRGAEADKKYLYPWIDKGLVIYGGPRNDQLLQCHNRGRISDEDLPKVYSSAAVNLNYSIPISAEYGVVNMRVYEILACDGNLMTDWHTGMTEFEPWALGMKEAGLSYVGISGARNFVLENHTWENRMATLVTWLKATL